MFKKIALFFLLISPLTFAQASDLIITEIQITGGEGKTNNDFIKIYNNSDTVIDLQGYRLVKRSANSSTDTSIKSWTTPTPLNPRGFYLWANSADGFATSINADCATSGTLAENNTIALRQGPADSGTIIDAISWGETANGLTAFKNFANPPDGKITIALSNETANSQLNSESVITNNPINNTNNCQDVVINEFLPAPESGEDEWVELYNNCPAPTDLTDWTLEDGSGAATQLSGQIDKFFIITSPKGQLNNNGDLLILKNPQGEIINQIAYGNWAAGTDLPTPKAGQSLARSPDGSGYFALTDTPSHNQANLISSATEVTTTEEKKSASSSPALIISELLPDPIGPDNDGGPNGYEFIELHNPGQQPINLKNWRLTIGEQPAYIFPEQILPAGHYFLLPRSTSRLSLNNQKETIKLYKPDTSKATQTVSYQDAPEGLSYNYFSDSKTWAWSLSKTPGGANFLTAPNQAPRAIINAPALATNQPIFFDGSDSFDPDGQVLTYFWKFGDGSTSVTAAVEKFFTASAQLSATLTVSDGWLADSQSLKAKNPNSTKTTNNLIDDQTASEQKNNLPAGQTKLTGIVMVEPGLFGAQYFYLAPLDSAGQASDTVIQVYNSKKDFPVLRQGDYLEATGELYDISTDTRLKINSADNLTILDHDYSVVEKHLAINQLKSALHNQIISVEGKITEKKSNGFWLDDGTGEIFVELKANTKLSAKHFAQDKSYRLTGLLRQGSKDLSLWPRSAGDIIEQNPAAAVLGEKVSQDSEMFNTNQTKITNLSQNKQKYLEYAVITAGGIIIGLAILLFKKKG